MYQEYAVMSRATTRLVISVPNSVNLVTTCRVGSHTYRTVIGDAVTALASLGMRLPIRTMGVVHGELEVPQPEGTGGRANAKSSSAANWKPRICALVSTRPVIVLAAIVVVHTTDIRALSTSKPSP